MPPRKIPQQNRIFATVHLADQYVDILDLSNRFLNELFPDYDINVIPADNIRSAFEKTICGLETIQDVTNNPSEDVVDHYLKINEEILK